MRAIRQLENFWRSLLESFQRRLARVTFECKFVAVSYTVNQKRFMRVHCSSNLTPDQIANFDSDTRQSVTTSEQLIGILNNSIVISHNQVQNGQCSANFTVSIQQRLVIGQLAKVT